jgi:Trk K+ transport system NAD-binding subunit
MTDGSRGSKSGDDQPDKAQYVIVAGFGPVGRVVAEHLERAGVHVTVIELNPMTVESQADSGNTFIFGDVTSEAVLKIAGLNHADALIVTVPDEEAVVQACKVARAVRPDIFIAARTNFLSRGMVATQAGANVVIVEEVVAAEAMGKAVMNSLLGGGAAGSSQSK